MREAGSYSRSKGEIGSASVVSPVLETALGASTNGKGSCGFGFRDKVDAEVCTEAAAHQAPPLLLLSSFFPNHLLQLFLWGPEQGEGFATGWGSSALSL